MHVLFTCAPDCRMCRPRWWAAGWGWCLAQDLEKPDRVDNHNIYKKQAYAEKNPFRSSFTPLWDEVCAGPSHDPRQLCETSLATPSSSVCPWDQTRQKRHDRPSPDRPDPPQTDKWASADTRDSPATTRERGEETRHPQLRKRKSPGLISLQSQKKKPCKCYTTQPVLDTHHSPGFLLFRL